jgi:hypothetical protein
MWLRIIYSRRRNVPRPCSPFAAAQNKATGLAFKNILFCAIFEAGLRCRVARCIGALALCLILISTPGVSARSLKTFAGSRSSSCLPSTLLRVSDQTALVRYDAMCRGEIIKAAFGSVGIAVRSQPRVRLAAQK